MKDYFETITDFCKNYFEVLLAGEEFPAFLKEYINTKEMLKQDGISVTCGTIYSKMYNSIWYSSLDHSIAVALIVWHFTHDKKQTLSGLLHDIATPAFKHSIDFMNGDYENQESTEELTTKIISNSKEIMTLLERDKIKIEEIDNYHIYPIADNDTPRLAADRLEYTFSNGLGATEKIWDLDTVKKIYSNIEILKNEDELPELGFKDLEMAEKFVHTMSKLSSLYIKLETKYSMQFLADIMKKMSEKGLITIKDLYNCTEKEMIERIENCKEDKIAENFSIWRNAIKINSSDEEVNGKYCINVEKVKIRYINPLVKTESGIKRIKDISENASADIERALKYKTKKYGYLDFSF